jgi:hypothetical protein
MQCNVIAGLLTASMCLAQEPAQAPRRPASETQAQEAPAIAKQRITVPAGTRIAVTLTNRLWTKSAHVGDAIHAVTVFPVTVGTTVAILAGTYVDGVIDKVSRHSSPRHPALQMHFARLLFANGHTVTLGGATAEAQSVEPAVDFPGRTLPAETVGGGSFRGSHFAAGNAFAAQQQPVPPPMLTPPANRDPSRGALIGLGVGAARASVIVAVLFSRRRGQDVVLEAGSQIEMVVQSPFSLDVDMVAAAVATPSGD